MRRLHASSALVLLTAASLSCSPNSPTPTPVALESEVEVLRPPVLTPEAVLPEADARLLEVIVEADALTFVYDSSGATPPAVGSVVVGEAGGGYLRRLGTREDISSTRFRYDTEVAELVDFFEDVHFRAHYEPYTTSWREGPGEVSGRTDALGGNIKLFPDLDISERCAFPIGSNVQVEADLQPSFDTEVDIFRRESRHLRVEVGGTLSFTATATLENGLTVECEFEIPSEDLPSREFTNVFAVGFVPVVITHKIGGSVKITTSVGVNNGRMEASATAALGFSVALDYLQGRGWEADGDGTRTANGSVESDDRVTASFGVAIEPSMEYTLKIYDALGPQIGLKPKVEPTASANVCEWEASVDGGLNVSLSPKLDVPVFDENLLEVDFNLTLIESQEIWSTSGTFRWCDDAGTEDAGMSSMDGGVMDSSTPPNDAGVDAPTDPCSANTTCDACTNTAGCGFCDGACVSTSRQGECTDWQATRSSCVDCSGFTDCSSCAINGFCGWCPSMGCLNDSTFSREGGSCPGYAQGVGGC